MLGAPHGVSRADRANHLPTGVGERLLYCGTLAVRFDEKYRVGVSGHGIWSLPPDPATRLSIRVRARSSLNDRL